MAKQRYIDTKFWSDGWIQRLDPTEKLLYLYLLTNERTTIAGVYELPLKLMAVETGIDMETIGEILKRFKRDKKILTGEGWIRLLNFTKHQDLENEKIVAGIKKIVEDLPVNIKLKLYPTDRVSIEHTYPPNNLNSNPNSNLNSNNIPPSGTKKPSDAYRQLSDQIAYETEKTFRVVKKDKWPSMSFLMGKVKECGAEVVVAALGRLREAKNFHEIDDYYAYLSSMLK